jgi:hypothetical protein
LRSRLMLVLASGLPKPPVPMIAEIVFQFSDGLNLIILMIMKSGKIIEISLHCFNLLTINKCLKNSYVGPRPEFG